MTITERVPTVLTERVGQVSRFRRWLAPATFVVFGLVDILLLGLFAHKGDATFAFSQPFAKVTVPNLTLPARITCFVCGGISIAIGVVWYLVLKARDPARAARLGSLAEQEPGELEGRIAAELGG